MKFKGRVIKKGKVEGEAVVISSPFSFVGDLDIATGDGNFMHELKGQNISGKILVFTKGRGTTSAALAGYYVKLLGKLPAGMICHETDPVIALNAIMNDFPVMDRTEVDPVEVIDTGDHIIMDADEGIIEVIKKHK
ncbi:MAG: DUF126 domain-containing protein, partial [bacterium]|nr:DUF126 domain-containing protein [bacterium]